MPNQNMVLITIFCCICSGVPLERICKITNRTLKTIVTKMKIAIFLNLTLFSETLKLIFRKFTLAFSDGIGLSVRNLCQIFFPGLPFTVLSRRQSYVKYRLNMAWGLSTYISE